MTHFRELFFFPFRGLMTRWVQFQSSLAHRRETSTVEGDSYEGKLPVSSRERAVRLRPCSSASLRHTFHDGE